MRDQFVVSVEDLRFLTLFCRDCHTKVTLDLEMEFDPAGPHKKTFDSPKSCPRCANSFDSAIPEAVNSMQRVYRALAQLGDAVTFAVAPAPPKP